MNRNLKKGIKQERGRKEVREGGEREREREREKERESEGGRERGGVYQTTLLFLEVFNGLMGLSVL